MNILTALYTLIISPLELLFENIFTIANRLIGNEGLSIIFLSLAVNFLVLPLYKRADELQAEERDIQVKMAPWIKHIKKTFTGDERFFMMQEYYRINNYKPVFALKSSVSVMLQIPFFIAAYNLLSGMQSLKGMQFGFIADLGREDAMFMIGSFPVNVLPILMTIINVVSGAIYTKGHPLKEKIQVYGLAAIFLVLLYRSPAGLVFYWLLNNVFSLLKNIFYKLKDPKKVLSFVLAAAGIALIISTLLRSDLDARQKVLLSICGVLLFLPLILCFVKTKREFTKDVNATAIFFSGAVMMALFTGLLIPSTIIDASALEFVDVVHPFNPAVYVVSSILLAFGSWVLWGGVFYFFMSDKTRSVFAKTIWVICGISVTDYMLFGTKLGTLSNTLKFDNDPSFSVSEYALNAAAVAAILLLGGFIYSKFSKFLKPVLLVGVITVFMIGGLHFAGICGTYNGNRTLAETTDRTPELNLSRNGKNVIVLMLDRALGADVPYIFNEKPELKEKFSGFTYYPNTISYGIQTNFAAPALYGGYEYTPERLNARSDESLADKHDEALKVMPDLFSKNGYKVTISDPPYAGYKWISDLSIFDPSYTCFKTMGYYNFFDEDEGGSSSADMSVKINHLRNRNLFLFSLMKVSPVILQETVYNGGMYNDSSSGTDSSSGFFVPSVVQKPLTLSKSTGFDKGFLDSYTVLSKLDELTKISDGSENTFLMMANDATHSPCLLQQPGYVPSDKVDNTAYDVDMINRYTVNGVTMKMTGIAQISHYHVNMAAFIKLSEWFDYLREQGVYDNTRIILVSDHGRDGNQFGINSSGKNMEGFMPLLMVKDFNAKGFSINEEFMTNADTPVLAMEGLIKDPVNPFTGKPIDSSLKKGPQKTIYSDVFIEEGNDGNTFLPGSWFTVEGDPHVAGNWKYDGDR